MGGNTDTQIPSIAHSHTSPSCLEGLEGKGKNYDTVLLNRVEATLRQFPEKAGNKP